MLFCVFASFDASGGEWWDEVNDPSVSKATIVKKARRKPEARALDALVGLTMRRELCGDRAATAALLAMGASPSARRVVSHGIYHWDSDYFYSTYEPVFWIALRVCSTPDLARQFLDAGGEFLSGWQERDTRYPDYRDTMLLERRREASRYSWLAVTTADLGIPVANRRFAAQAYLEVAETGTPARKDLARANVTMGGRPVLLYYASVCMDGGSRKRCRSPEEIALFKDLVAVTQAFDLEADAHLRAAMVPLIDGVALELAQPLVEAGVELAGGLPSGVTADHLELYAPVFTGLTIADYLILEGSDKARELFGPLASAPGVALTPAEELEKRMQRNLTNHANELASLAAWDAEVEARAASGAMGRAVNACIARGVDGATCMRNPTAQRQPDTSLVRDLFDPARVEQFNQLLHPNFAPSIAPGGGSATPTGAASTNLLGSGSTPLPTAQDGPKREESPCGWLYQGQPPPPNPNYGTEAQRAASTASEDRFYAEHPGCTRPQRTDRPKSTGDATIMEE